ncbi:MAG: dTMP kinase [Chlorobi bacterium]|nr:dTMP kinase [Chlorobiota bacterium]
MKFIVIEGLDGAGKSTQINLLQEYFNSKKINFKYLHFPRTDSPIYGELIAKFLRGELGAINTVHPYLVALIYAGDRENASLLINKWLSKKYVVLVDRYVFSNIAFQCAKLKDTKEKEELRNWIKVLEYQYFKIPVPDISVYLDVPFSFTKSKLKSARTGSDREYLKGSTDIHEESIDFQDLVKQEYYKLLENEKDFFKIDCSRNIDSILPPEDIFSKILELLQEKKIVS